LELGWGGPQNSRQEKRSAGPRKDSNRAPSFSQGPQREPSWKHSKRSDEKGIPYLIEFRGKKKEKGEGQFYEWQVLIADAYRGQGKRKDSAPVFSGWRRLPNGTRKRKGMENKGKKFMKADQSITSC